MKSLLKFLLAIAIALIAVLAFRALVFSVYTIDGKGLEPQFLQGDRVVVNRWSYGLRTGERGSLFDYGRICRQAINKGDIVAFEDSLGQVLICRCKNLPGDTLSNGKRHIIVPGLVNCADQDYYWLEAISKNNSTDSRQLGFIPEQRIIGRVCLILYSHDPASSLWSGYRNLRFLLPI
ncbi:MAG: signal peptidase I [Prevotella sp.]|nr:signal peptidase I [Prevotella sp.]